MPAMGVARFNDLLKGAVFALAVEERLSRPQAATHDFLHEHAATAHLGDQPLAYDVTDRIRQALPKLLLLVLAEHSDDTVDGLPGIDCMERAENDVTSLGRGHRDFHGGAVANFAHQNHFWRLPERGPQAGREIGEILTELALVEESLFVRMQEFDGVFQGKDVDLLRQVQLI